MKSRWYEGRGKRSNTTPKDAFLSGYQGSEGALRSIRPKKKPKGRPLDRVDEQRNKNVCSDRVIVENYFGRLCTLWEICHRTFPWSESKYNSRDAVKQKRILRVTQLKFCKYFLC